MVIAILGAVPVERVIFVVRERREVERRRPADEHRIIGESITHDGVHRRTLCAIRVEGKLVDNVRRSAEQRERDAAGVVILHIIALEHGVPEALPQRGHASFDAGAVTGGVLIKNMVKLTCRGVICAELHSVIADNIYGVAVHLTEYAAAHPRADHQKLVLCAQCVKHTEVGLGKLRLVLGERAVKVKRDKPYLIHVFYAFRI